MKAKEFDKKINQQVSKVENTIPPTTTWNVEKSWNKIAALLNASKGKHIIWYCSLAATVSLVMGNVVEMTLPEPVFSKPEAVLTIIEEQVPKGQFTTPVVYESSQIVGLDYLKPKTINTSPIQLATSPAIFDREYELPVQPQALEVEKQHPVFITDMGLGFGSRGGISAIGEIGIMYPLKSKTTTQIGFTIEGRQHVHTTLSNDLMRESENSRALYLNLVLGKNSTDTQWRTKVGMPVLSNSDDLGLKIGYIRTLRGWLNVGPEIIFSRNFARIYPGVTVSFG